MSQPLQEAIENKFQLAEHITNMKEETALYGCCWESKNNDQPCPTHGEIIEEITLLERKRIEALIITMLHNHGNCKYNEALKDLLKKLHD